MNEFIQKQFTTGQFADMHGVNKRTLMYYDSIGLLKPAVVKENGYRYYTLRQALVFDAILLLRELHVPLKEIKEYFKNYTPENLLQLLDTQDQMLERQIAELLWLQRIVRNKVAMIEAKRKIDFSKIEVIEANAQAILLSEPIAKRSVEKEIESVVGFIRDCHRTRMYSGYLLGFMMEPKQLRLQGNCQHFTNCFYQVDENKETAGKISYKPAGRYRIGYYKGGNWQQIDETYQKLIRYANAHGLEFGDYAYEESLLDETAAGYPDYYEARISILLKSE
jgi:DNA-binding transcriptional MerR regulator